MTFKKLCHRNTKTLQNRITELKKNELPITYIVPNN